MKKLTALLLALTLCFGLAACGGNTAKDDTKDDQQTVETGKTEDTKDKTAAEDQSDAANKDAAAEDKPADTADADKSADTKSDAAKPVESKPVTGTANAAASKPNSTASAPASKPAASKPAESKPEPAKPTASQANGYVGSSASALESALGAPSSKSYSPSCMGDGEDGVWTYDGFTVYTYRENGTETVEAVQ